MTFAKLVDQIRPAVNDRLDKLFVRELAHADSLTPEVAAMVTSVRDLSLRGGKRLRAALAAAGYRTATQSRSLRIPLQVGVALELLQTYFLIHDDWMDGDLVRRGGPSAHAFLTERLGDAHLGASSAILAGDFAATLATQAMLAVPVSADLKEAALRAFCALQLDTIRGQQMDIIGSEHTVEMVYQLKTTRYTVAGPLTLGAMLGGGSPALNKALHAFAEPVGFAFQLSDDLLGVFGDPKKTGKPFASDLREGKRTELVNVALQRANPAERRVLIGALGNRKLKAAGLKKAVALLESTGARQAVVEHTDALIAKALKILKRPVFDDRSRALLEDAAQMLTRREA